MDGALNSLSWKVWVTLLLEDNDIWDILKVVVLSPIDLWYLEAHKNREVIAKQMALDADKDHFIPHIFEKKTMKEMHDTLVSLYQSENIKKEMIL
jgi:hypothetical protein